MTKRHSHEPHVPCDLSCPIHWGRISFRDDFCKCRGLRYVTFAIGEGHVGSIVCKGCHMDVNIDPFDVWFDVEATLKVDVYPDYMGDVDVEIEIIPCINPTEQDTP